MNATNITPNNGNDYKTRLTSYAIQELRQQANSSDIHDAAEHHNLPINKVEELLLSGGCQLSSIVAAHLRQRIVSRSHDNNELSNMSFE